MVHFYCVLQDVCLWLVSGCFFMSLFSISFLELRNENKGRNPNFNRRVKFKVLAFEHFYHRSSDVLVVGMEHVCELLKKFPIREKAGNPYSLLPCVP